MLVRLSLLLLISSQVFASPSPSTPVPAAPAVTVMRAVGQVGDEVLSSRDVILAGVIENWLYAIQDRPSETLRKAEKQAWFLELDSPAFRAQVSRVMIDMMINKEAENFAVSEVDQMELQKLSTRMMIDFATLPEWKRWSPDIAEVQLVLRRKMRSRAFLEFKSEGASRMVTDEEARQYFEANRSKFGPYPFAQFKNNIKEVMARDRVDARLKDWFEILKKKYRVRFLAAPSTSEIQ